MVSAINSALSGLKAAGARVEASANNIANQFSTKTQRDGRVQNVPYTPQRVDTVSLSEGGVRALARDVQPATTTIFDPENPDADANGAVAVPNVDTATEMVNMQIASYDYKANLKAIKVADNMEKSLLDILS